MVTVHLVFNAHIDPIWLWPWQSGVDTLLNTCRNACDKMDKYPELTFTKGEAYAYSEVEKLDPELFERIKKYVEAGRWHVVNGWWLQPDCNGPGGIGFDKQIELGKEYFTSRFGFYPRVGYNVDSFGHAATLPAKMWAAGQDRYVFMRPMEHEMETPARIFRWRGYEDGPEMVAFRIAQQYATREITEELIQKNVEGLPDGVEHTMCFVGLGDHGGGPSEAQIAWCKEHAESIPGYKLVFSSPDQFFDAIEGQKDQLPEVVGELQYHAVGCYSVHRPVKVGVHLGEQRLVQADIVKQYDPQPEPGVEEKMKEAWQWVCFGHFHDTFGGTCVASAYEQAHAQLGYSYTVADEMIHHGVRRMLRKLPDDKLQRIVLFNASDETYEGYAEHEPWLEHLQWQPHWRLIDEEGKPVAHQRMRPECMIPQDFLYCVRLAFPVKLGPGQMKAVRIDTEGGSGEEVPSRVEVAEDRLANDSGVEVKLGADAEMRFAVAKAGLRVPELELIEDLSDTWSHGVERYGDEVLGKVQWTQSKVEDAGPLMASVRQLGSVGRSEVEGEFRVYADQPYVEWLLKVYWHERHKLLKLTLPLGAKLEERFDGIPDGSVVRGPDGIERPVRDWTMFELENGQKVGLLFPDVYALDATSEKVRWTLLRSPLMAHHEPFVPKGERGVYADQSYHEFRFRFFCGPEVSSEFLDRQALMMHRPLVAADLTRGMVP